MNNKITFVALLCAFIMVIFFSACTKNYNYEYDINIENVNVTLNTKELVAITQKPFQKSANVSSFSTDNQEIIHEFPTSYQATFVSLEDKGTYKKGDIVKTFNVVAGSQNITVPALKYKVIVTNGSFTENQLKWETDLEKHLPKSTDKIILIGEKEISYADSVKGEINVKNPYSAIMITNNIWIKSAPIHYDNSQKLYKVINGWYLLYVRDAKGENGINTGVPVNTNLNILLMKNKVDANTIYQYTLDGESGNINGNFIVNTVPMTKIIKTVIKF